jgi:hypothetical protein
MYFENTLQVNISRVLRRIGGNITDCMSIVLLEKLTGPHLAKKFTANSWFNTAFTKARHLSLP